jgi:predicted HTH transcriptional regulator
MPRLTETELRELLQLGHEVRGVEFKSSGSTSDNDFFGRVIRAVLAMANRRDGGVVVVGVEDDGTHLTPTGVTAAALPSWQFADVSARIAPYADPFVEFELDNITLDGKPYVALSVKEFAHTPIVCKRDCNDHKGRLILKAGACYVRTHRQPESAEIPTQSEMRELLELAIDKGVREFLRRSRAVGVALRSPASDDQLYDDEAKDLT